jgi:hypothetical protein
VKEGDVVSAFYTYRPHVIGIIDGKTYPDAAVWYKDILFALDRGVAVYGAGAIGAVRAVELEMAGMIGIGDVYQRLKRMEVFGDDEVLTRCEETDEGWVRRSEPLVNLRGTFECARESGVIGPEECASLIGAAKKVFYQDRTLAAVLEMAAQKGLGADLIDRIADFTRTHYVNMQKQDAIALLHTIKGLPESINQPQDSRRESIPESFILHVLKYHDRDVEHDGIAFPLYSMAYFAVLNHPDAEGLALRARNRLLLRRLAFFLGVQTSEEETGREAMEFRKSYGLTDDAVFTRWLTENDQLREDFHNLMRENVTIRKLYEWNSFQPDRKRITKALLDELRLRDEYREYAQLTADAEKISAREKAEFVHRWRYDDPRDLILDQLSRNPEKSHASFLRTVSLAGLTPEHLKASLVKAKMLRDQYASLVADTMAALERAENSS